MLKVFGTLLLVVGISLAKSHDGSMVLKTSGLNRFQTGVLRNLMVDSLDFDFWREPQVGFGAEIMADEAHVDELEAFLAKFGIDFEVKIQDVGSLIRHVETMKGNRKLSRSPRYALDWDDYYGHDDINAFIDELAATYEYVDTVSIGSSYEGRDMRVIQIGKAGAGAPNIWIEAGIHAREWISPAVSTYMISELVERYDAHPEYVDGINFHFLPVANPDGYEYTRSEDRLWRKTRSFNEGSACLGSDPNRNFDWHWAASGTSPLPCSDTYPGSEPFSEVETQNIRDYVSALSPRPELASALHSAAELWLWPYGWAYDTFPPNYQEMSDAGDDAVAALEAVHGIKYTCENSAELYPAAGDANDWYTGVIESRYTYTVELRDQGYGFILPADQIIPSGEETFAAYATLFDKVLANNA